MALPSNKVLAEYLQSPTWSNSRDLLKLHPELLDPAVDVLVERMIGYARDEHNEMGRGELEQQLGLLRRSRQVGADAAFAELSGQPRSYVVVEDQDMVRQQAEDAQQYYERTGDHDALTLALNLWLRIHTELQDPAGNAAGDHRVEGRDPSRAARLNAPIHTHRVARHGQLPSLGPDGGQG